VIHPYRLPGGTWAFDDPARGLFAEPFVGETNLVIDDLARGLPGAFEHGIQFTFSGLGPFPGCRHALEFVSTGSPDDADGRWSGCWYRIGARCFWLCPALFRYFNEAPDRIWLRVAPLEGAGADAAGHDSRGAARGRAAAAWRGDSTAPPGRTARDPGVEHLYLIAPRPRGEGALS
jgi:hypothetical protein